MVPVLRWLSLPTRGSNERGCRDAGEADGATAGGDYHLSDDYCPLILHDCLEYVLLEYILYYT
jgi:hypothetical protein